MSAFERHLVYPWLGRLVSEIIWEGTFTLSRCHSAETPVNAELTADTHQRREHEAVVLVDESDLAGLVHDDPDELGPAVDHQVPYQRLPLDHLQKRPEGT